MEAFTTKGIWWLPENPGTTLDGTLDFDPSRRVNLALSGSFHPIESGCANKRRHEPIILGVGEKGQAITLVDCPTPGPFFSSSDYIWYRSTYYPRVIIQGKHYSHDDDVKFERLIFDYYGLSEWASTNQGWGTIDFDNLESVNTAFKAKSIVCVHTDNFRLNIWRGYDWKLPHDSISVQRGAWIEIEPRNPWGYKEYLHKIYQLQIFLGMAMRAPTWPLSVNIPVNDKVHRLLPVHFTLGSDFRKVDSPLHHPMLFTLEDIQPELALCLENWFARFGELKRILRSYQNVITKGLEPDDELLYLTRAIEGYHRLLHDELYVPESEFEAIYEAMISAIPDGTNKEFKKRLERHLGFANHLSLGGRLKRIRRLYLSEIVDLFSSNNEYKSFVGKIVSARNDLTHVGDKNDEKDDAKLDAWNKTLRLILEICLLSTMGLDTDSINRIVNWHIPHALNRTPSTWPSYQQTSQQGEE